MLRGAKPCAGNFTEYKTYLEALGQATEGGAEGVVVGERGEGHPSTWWSSVVDAAGDVAEGVEKFALQR